MTQVEMKCPLSREETADLLLDYSAGRLDKARVALLERHMKNCEGCAAFGLQQGALWAALDEWEPEPVSMDFNRRMWQKIDLLEAEPWYRRLADSLRLGGWKPAIPLVAAVVLVATAFVMDHSGNVAQTHDVSITEVDQVEKTLDDVQLLKQFDSTVTETGASKTAM
jgi:predicted anti-sigma-YlaC factor YlaD